MAQETTVVETPLQDACGSDPNLICEWVFEQTDSEAWASIADWFLDRPLRVVLILILASLAARIGRRIVSRFATEVGERSTRQRQAELQDNLLRRRVGRVAKQKEQTARAEKRSVTLGSMLESLVSIVVWTTASFLILGEIGISLGPLIASAGIVGIAVGFGAQSIVRDFLAGFFVIIEDQYGVGDVIDVGEAIGTVEEVGFRTTQVRDESGVLWTVPNGVIQRIGNYSQIWSKAIFDIEVSYDTDIDKAMVVIKTVLDKAWHENEETATIIEEPEVQGVQSFGESAVVVRAVVKTDPAEQWAVARMINGRLKKALDEAEIEIPFPQRTVWVKNDDSASLTRG